MSQIPQFIADVHLGRLAKSLRLLGLDTLYTNHWSKPELIRLAVTEHRVLLSRNAALAPNPFTRTLIITSEDPVQQLEQVVLHFSLTDQQLNPYSRCLVCNEPIVPVPKEAVAHLIPEQTRLYYHRFWQCPQCLRVYWKGAHYQRMQELIARVVGFKPDE